MLPPISPEQNDIVKSLKHHHVLVDSVAGSGKTTTALQIAREYVNDNILLLTYNARLKSDTRTKIVENNLSNIEAHSYHSFCTKYYDHLCHTDAPLRSLVQRRANKLKDFRYQIIVIDEAQDITELYYELILKIIFDNRSTIKLCILGDAYQSIYQFMDADHRFLTFSSEIYDSTREWIRLKLGTSYRLSHEAASFVNDVVLHQPRISAIKSGSKPRYIICDTYNDDRKSRSLEEVYYYFDLGYKCNDIFILAPSVRSAKTPVRSLANSLSEQGFPVFVPNSDEEKLDPEIIQGKISFSSYHQAKGLERPVVIVYCFDSSYFKYYNRNANPYLCANEQYVAITRSRKEMTLIHHYNDQYLSFIQPSEIDTHCYSEGKIKNTVRTKQVNNKKDSYVTDLTRHLPETIVDEVQKFFDIKVRITVDDPSGFIKIPTKVRQGELYENVSEITGTAIPAYFEFISRNTMRIFDGHRSEQYAFIDDPVDTTLSNPQESCVIQLDETLTPAQLLYIANKWNSKFSGYTHKLHQIKDYNWLSESDLSKSCERLTKYISKNSIFEHVLTLEDSETLFDRKLIGAIDCVDGDNVWEFKCVKKIDITHVIQLAIYMFMILSTSSHDYKFHIFNILNENLLEITSDLSRLRAMMKILIQHKYFPKERFDDRKFMEHVEKIQGRYRS